MAHTHRAPKQWTLGKNETVNNFDSWRQNLLYTLSCDEKTAVFLVDDVESEKKTTANPTRVFQDDGSRVEEERRRTAVQKVVDLELMLGQIGNFLPCYRQKYCN